MDKRKMQRELMERKRAAILAGHKIGDKMDRRWTAQHRAIVAKTREAIELAMAKNMILEAAAHRAHKA